ncbi:hypothetical protein NODU109028_10935 [Nocardioides dubius]
MGQQPLGVARPGHRDADEVDLLGALPVTLGERRRAGGPPRGLQHAVLVEPAVEDVDALAGGRIVDVQQAAAQIDVQTRLDQRQRDLHELLAGLDAGPVPRDVGAVEVVVVPDRPAVAHRAQQAPVEEERLVAVAGDHQLARAAVEVADRVTPHATALLRRHQVARLGELVALRHQLLELGEGALPAAPRGQVHAVPGDRQRPAVHPHREPIAAPEERPEPGDLEGEGAHLLPGVAPVVAAAAGHPLATRRPGLLVTALPHHRSRDRRVRGRVGGRDLQPPDLQGDRHVRVVLGHRDPPHQAVAGHRLDDPDHRCRSRDRLRVQPGRDALEPSTERGPGHGRSSGSDRRGSGPGNTTHSVGSRAG